MDLTLDHLVLQDLLEHLRQHPEVQNITIMNAAGFCRNCLAKWRHRAAKRHPELLTAGTAGMTYEDSLKYVYGMPYDEYKTKFQLKASEEELEQFKQGAAASKHAAHEGFDPSAVVVVMPTRAVHSSVCCQEFEEDAAVCLPPPPPPQLQSPPASSSPVRVGILVLSDRAHRGEYEDKSGPAIQRALLPQHFSVQEPIVVLPDDEEAIYQQLVAWSSSSLDCILTTGGTGLGSRDVTPQATLRVITRRLPGVEELLRRESARQQEPVMAWLSRAVCGTTTTNKKQCVILNLPGHPNAAGFCTNLLVSSGILAKLVSNA